jgi:hypothetical protein
MGETTTTKIKFVVNNNNIFLLERNPFSIFLHIHQPPCLPHCSHRWSQIAFHRLQGIFFEMFVFILPGYTREIVRLLYNSHVSKYPLIACLEAA